MGARIVVEVREDGKVQKVYGPPEAEGVTVVVQEVTVDGRMRCTYSLPVRVVQPTRSEREELALRCYPMCPACSSTKRERFGVFGTMFRCMKCGGLYGIVENHEEGARIVRPYFDQQCSRPRPECERYFDLGEVDPGGKLRWRRHGWYNPVSLCMTQQG